MHDPQTALSHANSLIDRARRAGADAADAVYVSSSSSSVQVRLGRLEDVERSESAGIGLRAFAGRRSASASTSDLSDDALSALVERVVAMARAAPEDAYAGLADAALLTHAPFSDLDVDDRQDRAPETLRAAALAAEGAALAVAGVTNSQGASAGNSRSVIALATSTGFAGAYAGTSHSVSATVLAGDEGAMQRDYASSGVRHVSDLESPEAVGKRAGERAVARLSPIRLKSGAMPVMFDPRVASTLLGHFAGAISGDSIARGTSFLKDRLGRHVFAPGVEIIDDPLRPRGLRSKAFDAEGLATRRVALIEDGVLTQWIAHSAAARQLGIAPTGHAQRGLSGAPGAGTSNLHLGAGQATPAELMADIKHGLYVTELIGMGVNGLTGDYSRGASGFVIENGEIGGAVSEVTIAGNLLEMFVALIPANDLEFRYATNAPTVRVDGMMLAGA